MRATNSVPARRPPTLIDSLRDLFGRSDPKAEHGPAPDAKNIKRRRSGQDFEACANLDTGAAR